MTLDARRIALQGFGAAALAIAVQGFTTTVVVPPSPPFYGGGGGGYARFNEDHDWRKELADAAKARRIKAQNQLIVAAVMAAVAEGMFE